MRNALPLLLLLSGCIAQAAPGHHLAGSEWRFVTIDGDTPVSQDARLEFQGDQIGANIGCNSISGPWRVEDGRLVAGPLAQTKMFCAGPVWDQELAAGALLVAAPELELDGNRLVLRSRGHEAELERIDPPAQAN